MRLDTNHCPSGDEKVVLFGLLLETNARLAKDFGAELETKCDLPLAWFDVLLQLRRTPDGRLKMNQIADAIVHSTGGTTRLIDRLEESGYVRRENCPSDRRAIYVAITDAGNAKLDEALNVHLAFLDENLATRLSDAERETLSELLNKLIAVA
ncbi:MAG: MarR family transcriptional regulator [Acidobacteriota bacterium]|nr:MarR family transcriptional regulator [Acidobacteriota bacterium]MDE3044662.1 MarR family transcriptional regulator [Acidobacteriota bacterium]